MSLPIRSDDCAPTIRHALVYALIPPSRHRSLLLAIAIACALPVASVFAGEIHQAAANGFTSDVVALLKETPALASAKDEHGNLPLHVAALHGWSDVIAALLDGGADVNARGQNDSTPLHFAALSGSPSACKLLLHRGALRDARNGDQVTPQDVAKVSTASVLRDFVPKARGTDELFRAIKAGDLKKAETLAAAHPAALAEKDDEGRSPLVLAAAARQPEIVRFLLQRGADVNARGKNRETALHWAVGMNSPETTRALLQAGAKINAQDFLGHTPLTTAVERRDNAHASILLAAGANLELTLKAGQTALLLAAENGFADTARILLEAGAKTNARLNNGVDALQRAAIGGKMEGGAPAKGTPADFVAIAKMLLDAGVPADIRDLEAGWTPLHIAATHRNVETARLLLARGAKVDSRSKDGRTPLHLAAMMDSLEMLDLLLDHGAAIDSVQQNDTNHYTPLLSATEAGQAGNIKLLLRRGANLHAKGFTQRASALHTAARHNHVEVAKVVLAAGLKVDVRDADGVTPLAVAANGGSQEVAEFLIANGADVNAEFGATNVLRVANTTGHTAIATLLKANGAKE